MRRLINDKSSPASKEYGILDFNYEEECTRQMMIHLENENPDTIEDMGNFPVIMQYINGTLPTAGRSWLRCKYLLIPYSYPGNTWYLFLVNIPQWKVEIYDCSNNVHTPDQIRAHSRTVIDLTRGILMTVRFENYRRYIKKTPDRPLAIDIKQYHPAVHNGYG